MDNISLMVEEHRNIKRMLSVARNICFMILKNEQVVYEDFLKVIDFVRSYADNHHHGKEEKLLFDKMMQELGPTAEKLVKLGMYVEHDQGRLYIQDLEVALKKVMDGDEESKLDLIANAISYTHLLHRHIDKEDTVVYVYAQNNLSQTTMDGLDKDTTAFEEEASEKGIQDKYLNLLDELEKKYVK